MIKSVGVFCGSKMGNNANFEKETISLGKYFAQQNISIIYGGGNKGLMGALANAALENSGIVIGIIPEQLALWEHAHDGLHTLEIVDGMHKRKTIIYNQSDAIVILPGGFGTLDELFETITWNTLKIHDKKVFILNIDGYYNHLIAHMAYTISEGFAYNNLEETVIIVNNTEELKALFNKF